MKRFFISLAVCCLCLIGAREAGAQTPRDGRLLATVIDPSKAVIMGATVTVTGAEDATKGVTIAPVKTVEMGLATIEGLRPGRYTVQAEFPGFQTTVLKDVRIRAGDNKHLIVLPLKNVEDSVTVGRDAQAAAAERRSLGSALTREQIELLSDDPDEMDRQLKELAGMNATIRVDSFEGNQLPPKSQIKSIHITRDQYAAESHYVGHTFVDIITQPGMGPLRGNVGFNFRDGSMSGRNQFTQQKGPEQYRRFNAGFGGTIAKQRTSFSINMNGSNTYDTPNLFVSLPGGTRSETLNIRVPRESYGIGGYLDHALTRDQTLRVNVNMNRGENRNLGIGAYDLPERGYSTKSRGYSLMVQEAGPLGRRFFINTRLSVRVSDTESRSFLEAPTIRVTDGFNEGGAQRAGGSHNRTFTLQSDLDYIRGIHSWRTGIQVDGAWIRSDDTSNYLGTYTFTSVEAFEAGLPTFYTRRLGDPLIRYSNFQVGLYVQDDIRVSKTLTLSPGLRYEAQTHVRDYNGLAPRFGVTWSPFKSGKTSIRAGGGVFYDWLSTGTYAQTLRVDGFRQQELTIVNPTFPDPGSFGTVRATNRYLLGPDLQLIRNVGYSIGVDQRFSPRIFVGINYTAMRSAHILRGRNLNLPVNGTRPDPAFANVIETVADASGRRHSVNVHSSFNFLAPSPTASRARFNWRRFSMFGFYSYNDGRNNSDGPFSFPASGTIDTEWGPEGSQKHNVNWSINSSALRNLNVNFGYFGYSGSAYTITTGFDENGDLLFNDRPVGVGRNTERVPNWYQQWSARVAYTIGIGRAVGPGGPGPIMIGEGRMISGPGGAPGAPRYRINIGLSVQNLTNRANLSGYSGVMTSKFFRTPTNAGTPRKVDLNVSFSF